MVGAVEDDPDPDDNDADATVTVTVADLDMAKSADVTDPDPGDTVIFTLTVTNQGPAAATGVTVTDTLPAGLTYVSDDCSAAFVDPTLTWTIGALANLAAATCEVTAAVDSGASGTIVNTATVDGDEHDPDLGDNDADATLTVDPAGFYSLTPCRLVDTRDSVGPYGGPALAANVARSFTLVGSCGIPAEAVAVFLVVTVVGADSDGAVQVYEGAGTPLPDGGIVRYRAQQPRAGNAIVALGPAGAVEALAQQPTGSVHLILDVAGYFR